MYLEPLSSAKPGLIMILLDQSGSMADKYSGSTKAAFAALAVNRVISNIITACSVGDEIKNRCYVAVIGYGNSVNTIFIETVSKLSQTSNITTVKKKISDGAGGLVDVDELLQTFVSPVSSGGTPMAEALGQAYKGAESFILRNPNSFPPIVINITDGEPNDSTSAIAQASKLAQLKTTDGNVVILNAHISNASGGKEELPSSNANFSSNQFANFLFDISSVLPDPLAEKAKDQGFNIQPGAKGFVFNADAETLVRILNFGSLGMLR